MGRQIYIEYRKKNLGLVNAYSVELASDPDLPQTPYGIKVQGGSVVVPPNTSVSNPDPGVYTYEFEPDNDLVYIVSWKIVHEVNGRPQYIVDTIGPFTTTQHEIRAVTEFRGDFVQGTRASVFCKIFDLNGKAVEPDNITVVINDSVGTEILSGVPEKIEKGFFVFDWLINEDQTIGDYYVLWQYSVDSVVRTEQQSITVVGKGSATHFSPYHPRLIDFRESLSYMIQYPQRIPVYREPAKASKDYKTFEFTFPRWNQSAGVKLFVNDKIYTQGMEIDFFNGRITLDNPLTEYDRVDASYSFRWFSDEELDRFLSNALHVYNSYPPVGRKSLYTIEDRAIPSIMYGAAVDALRSLMLSLKFVEPQLVFGGPEAASKAFGDLDTLKKNYEDTWNKLLEQKKYGPYKGLTKIITTPAFHLPGGRSRWFRYLFSGN